MGLSEKIFRRNIADEYARGFTKQHGSTSADASTSLALVPGKDADFGSMATIKTFYEGKNSVYNNYDWVDSPPKQLATKVARANDRNAIKVFKIKDNDQQTISGRTPLKIHTIEVQSPLLVAVLKEILEDERVFLEATEIAKFDEPFKPLFFCHDKIYALYQDTKVDTTLKQHLHVLVQVIDELFGGFMAQLKNLRASELISFKLAWTYFHKGCVVYSGAQDCTRVCRVIDMSYQGSNLDHLVLDCQQISFDGSKFEWEAITLTIPSFTGNVPISSLNCFPLEFHPDQGKVKAKLTARAKKVLVYQELHYREYTGVGIFGSMQKHNVAGRVLIDSYGYNKHYKGMARTDATHSTENTGDPDQPGTSSYVKRLSKEQQKKNTEEMLARPNDLLFVSPMLEGFALNNKLWLSFYVDDLREVEWNDDAYSHLVYPEEQKDLVLTFVENHKRLNTGVDDVIMGKGQGLVLLLSGPPGTGKTLTAEGVADKSRRPLYYLQAEDLGINAGSLGPKLKKVFAMATEWDAVILLDEADVFMAERAIGDIARNELVSIFLRELEYFQGIIFLTTNLYSTIDTAFRSRVNIHLLFNPLPFASRLVLWQKFLSRLQRTIGSQDLLAGLSSTDFVELAKWDLNGREIKNSIKTVRTWCLCKGLGMDLTRLESGISVTAPQAKKIVEIQE